MSSLIKTGFVFAIFKEDIKLDFSRESSEFEKWTSANISTKEAQYSAKLSCLHFLKNFLKFYFLSDSGRTFAEFIYRNEEKTKKKSSYL